MENAPVSVQAQQVFQPPEPIPCTLRIGVTGHRNLASAEDVETAVADVIGRIRDLIGDARQNPFQHLFQWHMPWTRWESGMVRLARKVIFSFSPSSGKAFVNRETAADWVVVSSLAMGADRIVARKAIELLQAKPMYILPFAAGDYCTDFPGEEDRAAFRDFLDRGRYVPVFDFETEPAPGVRWKGYLRAGEKVVESCEILIAVWDGKETGKRGGTAEVVEYATRLNRKVIWIDSTEPQRPPLLIRHIDRTNGYRVVTSPFPDIPAGLSPNFVHFAEYNRDSEFRQELFGSIYERNMRDLERARDKAGLPPEVINPLLQYLLPHYAKADCLATRYKIIYERAAGWLYLLTAIAVSAAVLQALLAPGHARWLFIEVVTLLTAFVWFRWGKIRNWHEKWLNNRHLAERLRILTFSSFIPEKKEQQGKSPEEHLPFYPGPGAWVVEASDHIRKEMPHPEFTPDMLGAIRSFVLEGWIKDQERFHRGSAGKKLKKSHNEHLVIGLLLFLTITAASVHMLGIIHNELAEKFITATAIILPAFASAIHAISVVRDRERIAARYGRMAEILSRLERTISDAGDMESLSKELRNAEEIMSTEIHEWCVSLGFRKVSLPV